MIARTAVVLAVVLAGAVDVCPRIMEARQASGPAVPPGAGECDARAPRAKLDFKLKDLHGASVRLADFKGKVIVLNFWATWCAPCKTEIPDFVELQAQHGDAGLQMVGISVDDTVKQLEPFAAALQMNYPVLQGRGQNGVLDAYAIASLPVTVLIRRDGAICTRYAAPVAKDVLERQIKALL
jgi:peroxiredoxin